MPALLDKIFQPRIKYGLFLVSCLAVYLLMNNLVFGRLIGGFWGNYALPALLWALLALGVCYLLPAGRTATRLRHRRLFCWVGFFCGAALVLALFATGLLDGLGRSPYDHSFLGIVINFFYLASMLTGMELSRAWIINCLFRKRPVSGIALTAFALTFFAFPLRRLASLDTALEGARFAGNMFLPALSENLVASYLAYLAGPFPALIYRSTLHAFQWFSPILPDLNWVVRALVGTFVPAFSMVFIHQLYRSEVLRKRTRDKEGPAGWIATSAISVVMIWFAVGVFSVFPNVIISGSMSPYIEVGDVVLVQRTPAEQIKAGDVLQFNTEERIRVAHRVIDISEDGRGRPLFQTKGDANPSPDTELVYPEQVIGRVIRVIPKAGWITLWIRGGA